MKESDSRLLGVDGFEEVAKMDAKQEIERAIRMVRDGAVQDSGTIRVLPTMPVFRYSFTCRSCGGHVRSHVVLDDGSIARFCMFCSEVKNPYGRE